MHKRRRREKHGTDRAGMERMYRVVRESYGLNGHDSETFNLMVDLESALEGREPLRGDLVRRYGELMKRLDER